MLSKWRLSLHNYQCLPKGGTSASQLWALCTVQVTKVEGVYHSNTFFLFSALILRKTCIFSLDLQWLKSSFIMLPGGDTGVYIQCDPEYFFFLRWCTFTYTDTSQSRKIRFLEHYSCFKFEQQKITKGLVFTHI